MGVLSEFHPWFCSENEGECTNLPLILLARHCQRHYNIINYPSPDFRAKRFPRGNNERITNKYGIGDWLEVQDTQTLHWITATVIDRENNWIVVHFDGWPSKYDQKIHAVKHGERLRPYSGFKGQIVQMQSANNQKLQ